MILVFFLPRRKPKPNPTGKAQRQRASRGGKSGGVITQIGSVAHTCRQTAQCFAAGMAPLGPDSMVICVGCSWSVPDRIVIRKCHQPRG